MGKFALLVGTVTVVSMGVVLVYDKGFVPFTSLFRYGRDRIYFEDDYMDQHFDEAEKLGVMSAEEQAAFVEERKYG